MKFVGKVAKMGDKLLIVIPKEHHKEAEKLQGKHVTVDVELVL